MKKDKLENKKRKMIDSYGGKLKEEKIPSYSFEKDNNIKQKIDSLNLKSEEEKLDAFNILYANQFKFKNKSR